MGQCLECYKMSKVFIAKVRSFFLTHLIQVLFILWPADIFPIDLALVPKWPLVSDAHYFIER